VQGGGTHVLDSPTLQRRLAAVQANAELRMGSLQQRLLLGPGTPGGISLAQAKTYGAQALRGLVRTAGQMGAAESMGDQPVRRGMTAFELHCLTCPRKAGLYLHLAECIAKCGGWPGDGSDQCHGNCLCYIRPASITSVYGDDMSQSLKVRLAKLPPQPPAGGAAVPVPLTSVPHLTSVPESPPAPAPPASGATVAAGAVLAALKAKLAGKLATWTGLPTLDLEDVDLHEAEPTWSPTPGKKRSYGAVLFDDQGRVLLREPTGHFDGYAWTFPKGGQSGDEHPVKAAQRETEEETGYSFAPVGVVPGKHSTGSSDTYLLLGKVTGHDPDKLGDETSDVRWVSPEEAVALISQSTNAAGRQRDLGILKAAMAEREKLLAGAADYAHLDPQKHPAKKPAAVAQPDPEDDGLGYVPWLDEPEAPSPPPVVWPEKQHVVPPATVTLPGGKTARKVGSGQGSNPAAWYQLDDGSKVYVKWPHATGQVAAEKATRELAKLMGLPAPDGEVVEFPEGVAIVTPQMALSQLTPTQLHKRTKAERAAQLVHAAWTRNWDAVGENFDNILLGPDKQLVVIDHGGSLLWRAQGGLKEDGLPTEVDELTGLRDPATNWQTATVFGDVADATVKTAIKKRLAGITDEQIDAIVAGSGLAGDQATTVRDQLKARRDWMLAWAGGSKKKLEPATKQTAGEGRTRSGRRRIDGVSGPPPRERRQLDASARGGYPPSLHDKLHQGGFGHAGSPQMSSEHSWLDENGQSLHLPAAEKERRKLAFLREMGFTEESAADLKAISKALHSFGAGSYTSKAVQEAAEKYIATMPAYRGTIVRGVSVGLGADGYPDPEGYKLRKGAKFAVGTTVQLQRAESFSAGGGGITHGKNLLVAIERSTRAASMRGFTPSTYLHEDEVLVSGTVKYRVSRIERTEAGSGSYKEKKTIVWLEEIDPDE